MCRCVPRCCVWLLVWLWRCGVAFLHGVGVRCRVVLCCCGVGCPLVLRWCALLLVVVCVFGVCRRAPGGIQQRVGQECMRVVRARGQEEETKRRAAAMTLSWTGRDRDPPLGRGQTGEGRRAPWGCAAGAPYGGTASPPPPPPPPMCCPLVLRWCALLLVVVCVSGVCRRCLCVGSWASLWCCLSATFSQRTNQEETKPSTLTSTVCLAKRLFTARVQREGVAHPLCRRCTTWVYDPHAVHAT